MSKSANRVTIIGMVNCCSQLLHETKKPMWLIVVQTSAELLIVLELCPNLPAVTPLTLLEFCLAFPAVTPQHTLAVLQLGAHSNDYKIVK